MGITNMDLEEAKQRLVIAIDIMAESWSEDEKEDKVANAYGYYNNFEEDMNLRKMTPQEYLEYAFREIGYWK